MRFGVGKMRFGSLSIHQRGVPEVLFKQLGAKRAQACSARVSHLPLLRRIKSKESSRRFLQLPNMACEVSKIEIKAVTSVPLQLASLSTGMRIKCALAESTGTTARSIANNGKN